MTLEISADDISQCPVREHGLHVDGVKVVRLLQRVQPLSLGVNSLAREPQILQNVEGHDNV